MNRMLIVLFAFLATGCGKNACEELAECVGGDEEAAADASDAEIDACEEVLDASDCQSKALETDASRLIIQPH